MLRFAFGLLIAGALTCGLGAGEAIVHLRPAAVIATDRAMLSDIADITGDVRAEAELGGLLVCEAVGQAPVVLDAQRVRQALGKRTLGWSLRIDGECRLTRSVRVVSERELIEAAITGMRASGGEMDVSLVRAQGDVTVLDGAGLGLVADPLDRAASGDVAVRVRVMRDDREIGRALITLKVVRYRQAMVSARLIKRGEVIAAADLRRERLIVGRGDEPFSEIASVVGAEARIDLAEGVPLGAGQVVMRPAVRGGQALALIYSGAGIHLTAAGEAMSDGGIGEVIQVRRDGRVLKARITATGEAQVNF